ncbi:MAG: amidase family protein [Actinomycetota bacterium]
MANGLVGCTAVEIADRVRSGKVSPAEVVRAHLDQIAALDGRLGAFQLVRSERALAEAEELGRRADLADLVLAGVPVAIKDNIPVAGEPMRNGSTATSDEPQASDHEVVRRLRAAGAIIIGSTRLPELAIWPMSDGAFGTARNPWNLDRTPGGSSGGSAAAVAAAMVPVAHGNDGGGSIRIPAADCGIFGIKPGSGVVPSDFEMGDWYGMAVNGPLATTVDDAALVLSVMAGRADLRGPQPPERPLRIAVSTVCPVPGGRVAPAFKAATLRTGGLLKGAGHRVETAGLKYPIWVALAFLKRWHAGVADQADSLDISRLEPRTRRQAAIGRWARPRIKVREREAWRSLLSRFFEDHDVLVMPSLARTPPRAEGWSRRSWQANLWASSQYAPMTAPWNLCGYPAAAVPAGTGPDGMPLSVQLIAPDGCEALILSVAKQIEQLRPWPRHAPIAGV